MFKVNYEKNTGEILGYYPIGVNYPNGVPEPTIEITGEQRQSTYGKIAKAVGGEFVVEDQPEPTPEEIKNSKIKAVVAWFKAEQDKRHTTLVALIASQNEVGQEKIRQSLGDLKIEYDNKIKEILQAAE